MTVHDTAPRRAARPRTTHLQMDVDDTEGARALNDSYPKKAQYSSRSTTSTSAARSAAGAAGS